VGQKATIAADQSKRGISGEPEAQSYYRECFHTLYLSRKSKKPLFLRTGGRFVKPKRSVVETIKGVERRIHVQNGVQIIITDFVLFSPVCEILHGHLVVIFGNEIRKVRHSHLGNYAVFGRGRVFNCLTVLRWGLRTSASG
jgi:hypothetical protein